MKWDALVKARHPPGFIEPCIPVAGAKVPEGPLWVHEIKHDGYRLQVSKRGDRARLFTRRGYDWSERYPRIGEAAKKIRGAFLIDGEAVVSDKRGISDFERLHSREHDKSATLWASPQKFHRTTCDVHRSAPRRIVAGGFACQRRSIGCDDRGNPDTVPIYN